NLPYSFLLSYAGRCQQKRHHGLVTMRAFPPCYCSRTDESSFCPFRFFFVTSPPILPVSFDVSDFHPYSRTLSRSPSSSATSYFIFSSSSRLLRSIGLSFFFPMLCLLSVFQKYCLIIAKIF